MLFLIFLSLKYDRIERGKKIFSMASPKKQQQAFLHSNARLLISVVGVILVWRGVWALCDRYLFPENPSISAVMSIIIGLIILYIEDRSLKELE